VTDQPKENLDEGSQARNFCDSGGTMGTINLCAQKVDNDSDISSKCQTVRCYCADYSFFYVALPTPAMAFSFLRFINHTQRRAAFSRTPLDE
jgi:hypothetical protein